MRNFYGVFVDYPKGKGGYGRTRLAHPIRSHSFVSYLMLQLREINSLIGSYIL